MLLLHLLQPAVEASADLLELPALLLVIPNLTARRERHVQSGSASLKRAGGGSQDRGGREAVEMLLF